MVEMRGNARGKNRESGTVNALRYPPMTYDGAQHKPTSSVSLMSGQVE